MKKLDVFLFLSFGWLSLFPLKADDLAIRERDFGDIEEFSGYADAPRSGGMLKRWWVNKRGPSQVLVPYPAELDARREAIIDAIWNDDEDAFIELVKSPLTGEGGLENQKFSKIVSALTKMDRWPLRSMRSHPVVTGDLETRTHITCFHQLMTLPKESKTMRRGNFNLIFKKDDWSLAFVRVNWWDADDQSLLPRPESTIDNDPVVDRGVPGDKEDRDY